MMTFAGVRGWADVWQGCEHGEDGRRRTCGFSVSDTTYR
jgi:hypothetical protein